MARRKKSQLSSEGKTELAKAIAEKGQTFARTYANVENSVAKFFRWLSGWLDKLLFNQKHGKLVALMLSVLFFVLIRAGKENGNLFTTNKQSIELNNVAVSAEISQQAYEVDGLPSVVKVTVIGELNDIQLVRSQSNYQVYADLSDLTEGTHEVSLKPKNFSSRLDVKLEPSTAVVTIKKKISKRFNLGYDFVNTSKMDNIYALSEPEFEQGEVVVRASEDTINQIAFVKALIDVNGVNADFETEANLVAYDQQGNQMSVDIIPKTMKTKVSVSTPNKNVPITIVPIGTVPNGKAIASYSLDYQAVTLYGLQKTLDTITELPISIPASTLTSDMSIPMPIVLPNGVTKASLKTVNISIKLEDSVTKEIEQVPVLYRNRPENMDLKPLNASEAYTTVILKGAQGVLDSISAEDITVVVDLANVTSGGIRELPLTVTGKNKLATYELKKSTTTIEINMR